MHMNGKRSCEITFRCWLVQVIADVHNPFISSFTCVLWWPYLRKVPRRRWISHTYPMWFWGYSLFKISSPGPILHGTKWRPWRPYKQSSKFHSKCRIDKGLIKMGSTIDHYRSQCKGRIIVAHPLCIHSFIHSYLRPLFLVVAKTPCTFWVCRWFVTRFNASSDLFGILCLTIMSATAVNNR
jgi:hypothetical protein